jgi:photosystem II stability/assembly factor-like uncharacterized protein
MNMKSLAHKFLIAATLVSLSWIAVAQSAPSNDSKDVFANVKFRNLGPAVGGGRVAAVAGVPGNPNIYYVGAAGGGVWKTVDGGLSWKAIFEKEPTSSIGAVALAPSNPNLVWVGTGEYNPRNDVITGKGVFFSPDGGMTWKAMGLADAGAISQIIVNPTNPDIVYVAVLGHIWGPNPDRGVYRTTDGGKNWQKVLFVDDKTGAIDLAMDPSNPLVLFAGMWEYTRTPWMLSNGGDNSGIFRSVDGGVNWKKLSEGLPKGPIGRIGLAIAPTNNNHVYALVNAKQHGGLYDSNDLGEHWKLVSGDSKLIYRGFYFTKLTVAPDNENHLYVLSFNILESFDGGKTSNIIARGVHVDNHAIWIDPKDPGRIIEGNDGGAYVSHDAGKTWRALDNMPIEQFYMVATDGEKPYMLCGGLQDNNGWCGPSNTLGRGGISGQEWFTATGGDGEYIVPAGHGSGIIYAESQNGSIQRLNYKNGMSEQVRPYLHGVEDLAPADLKYRFNWTSPIAVSPSNPKTVYIGGNVLFKSTDEGKTWTPVSGDLTRNDKTKQQASGGVVELDMSGAETFDTLLSMSISPTNENVIWTGSDDGVISVTKDGGKSWANVTPKGIPEWGRLQQIEVSPFSPETAYAAFDYHEVDNNKPYVFKTHDGGKTWTAINKGLPDSDPARVVREDPNQKGFLVLGTDTGLFYSHNDGETWTPLKSNFPTVPIYDIQFVKDSHDLLVATHGRGLFVLDDITPVEGFNTEVAKSDFHVFPMLAPVKWHMWNKRESSLGDYSAPNPPSGAVFTYYLSKDLEPEGGTRGPGGPGMMAMGGPGGGGRGGFGGAAGRTPVKIQIYDSTGQLIRTMYGPAKKGINRAEWNLRYNDAIRLQMGPQREENEFMARFGGGPQAIPGSYKVTISVNGKDAQTESFQLQPDPRFPYDEAAAKAQLAAALEIRGWVSAFRETLNRAELLKTQLQTMQRVLAADQEEEGNGMQNAAFRPVLQQARELSRKLTSYQEKVYPVQFRDDAAGRLHHLAMFSDDLDGVYRQVSFAYNQAPSPLVQEEMAKVKQELDKYLAEFNTMLKTDIPGFNKVATEKGATTLFAGDPISIKTGAASGATTVSTGSPDYQEDDDNQ